MRNSADEEHIPVPEIMLSVRLSEVRIQVLCRLKAVLRSTECCLKGEIEQCGDYGSDASAGFTMIKNYCIIIAKLYA